MKQLFADTFYWIASINPGDDWHPHDKHFTQEGFVILFEVEDEV